MFWIYARSIAEAVAKYAPVLTAVVAIAGVCIAYAAITAQKVIARKRAAIDFFLRTETDHYMLEAWQKYRAARKAVSACSNFPEFETSNAEQWQELRSYLNLHELLAVGIKQRVLDDSVCFDFWNAELRRACHDCVGAIEFIQAKQGEERTYCELVELHARWQRDRRSTRPSCSGG